MKAEEYKKYLQLIADDKLDDAINFRRSTMPKYIYKFYPLYSKSGRGKIDKRTFDTLRDNKIWCGKIEYFNDPYEGIGHYYGVDKEVEVRLASFLRVAAFAEDADSNISMWAYYTNSHKGFCVKYEVLDNRYLYDINYIEHRKSQTELWIDAIMKKSMGMSTEKEQLLIYEKYLTKHISWSNEKEYRIMLATETQEKYGRAVTCERIGLRPVKIYAGIDCSKNAKKRLNSISVKLGCGAISECAISDNEFVLINE